MGKRFCGSSDHAMSRRGFLGGSVAAASALAADMTVLDSLAQPALAANLKNQQKHVILLWLAGGASQLETWDPKPGAATGGPFAAIPTAVPGVHISELMPLMAKRMNHTCIVRSLNTKNGDHGGGAKLMLMGRREDPNIKLPDLGAMVARELGRADSPVPDYVSFYSYGEGSGFDPRSSGFYGARYSPMHLGMQSVPEYLKKLDSISDVDHQQRAELRDLFSKKFLAAHNTSTAASHATAYARVRGLMSSEKLFDIQQEPEKVRDRYGPTLFGQQALIARRLIEAGVPFVKLARAWWDSHGENFETHMELVPELDHVLSTLIDDLKERGLLENTLIITLAEFGRTPNINQGLGRDHFANAWSTSMSGCGIKGGACYGKTDATGNKVADGEISSPELFATIFTALGIDPQKAYHVGARPIPLTDPGTKVIKEVLA